MFIQQLNKYILIFILIGALFLLSQKVDKKFIGHHDWNGVWYGDIARNLLRYKIDVTKLGSIKNCDLAIPDQFRYFTHYPPLFPVILAINIHLFGDNETSLRMAIIPFSLLLIFLTYLIGKKIFNPQIGLTAAALTIIIPIYIYFGKMSVHEPVILPLILIGVYYYLKWFLSQKRSDFIGIIVGLGLAMLVTWPAYYVPAILFLHYLLFHPKKNKWRSLTYLLLMPFILFGLHILHTKLITGSFLGGGLQQIFLSRISSTATSRLYDLSFFSFILREARFFIIYYTGALIGLVVLWSICEITNIVKQRKLSDTLGKMSVLFFLGFIYPAFFREAAFLHDYLIYYFLPFITISGAAGLYLILNRIKPSWLKLVILFLALAFVFFERNSYVEALQRSNNSEKGYQLGDFISKISQSGDLIFVGSSYYGQFYAPYVCYYSGREVHYNDLLSPEKASFYKIIIRPKAHDALDATHKIYLDKNYIRQEDENYIWYETKK